MIHHPTEDIDPTRGSGTVPSTVPELMLALRNRTEQGREDTTENMRQRTCRTTQTVYS